jgi:hypothetical protein
LAWETCDKFKIHKQDLLVWFYYLSEGTQASLDSDLQEMQQEHNTHPVILIGEFFRIFQPVNDIGFPLVSLVLSAQDISMKCIVDPALKFPLRKETFRYFQVKNELTYFACSDVQCPLDATC